MLEHAWRLDLNLCDQVGSVSSEREACRKGRRFFRILNIPTSMYCHHNGVKKMRNIRLDCSRRNRLDSLRSHGISISRSVWKVRKRRSATPCMDLPRCFFLDKSEWKHRISQGHDPTHLGRAAPVCVPPSRDTNKSGKSQQRLAPDQRAIPKNKTRWDSHASVC